MNTVAPTRARRRPLSLMISLALVAILAPLVPTVPALAATLTVDSLGDTSDAVPGDGVCDDGTGACTLRAAIQEANADLGADTIGFGVAGTISSGSSLGITAPVVVDGTTAPGYIAGGRPVVEVSGSGSGLGFQMAPGVSGIELRALAINGFATHVQMDGDAGLVADSHIGTDPSGTTDEGPAYSYGVIVRGTGNTVAGSLISGMGYGVSVASTAVDASIVGNRIGTDVTGESAIPNQYHGVAVDNGADVTIGDGTAAGRNVISGNDLSGVSAASATPGGVTVVGNHIGTDIDGEAAIPNGAYGVILYGPGQVGDGTVGGRNVISGNEQAGVYLTGSGATVAGNYVGTEATGHTVLGNGSDPSGWATQASVAIAGGATDNTIGGVNGTPGGACTGDCNVIAGGFRADVSIVNGSHNVVSGNHIGIDVDGEVALSRLLTGGGGPRRVNVDASGGVAEGNVIGGATLGEANVIPLYSDAAISVYPGLTATDPTVVQGNRIGTNSAGTAIPIDGSLGASISGPAVVRDNQFGAGGLAVDGDVSVVGNLIGTDPTGTIDLGDLQTAIAVGQGAFPGSPTIGGPGGDANTIVGVQTGVLVLPPAVDVTIRGNVMRDIDIAPIDLLNDTYGSNGPTSNDPGDADAGANGLQNFPVLTSATRVSGQLHVQGTLDSDVNTSYEIDVYASDSLAPNGHGEAWTSLGSLSVTTDGSGLATIDGDVSEPPTGQDVITATATNEDGETSEFSLAIGAGTGDFAHLFVVDDTGDQADDTTGDGSCDIGNGVCTLRAAIQEANASIGHDLIGFELGAGNRIIEPAANLPTISSRLTIDGTTEPGFAGQPLVELRATNVTSGTNNEYTFIRATSPLTLRGVIINSVPQYGRALTLNGNNNVIQGNYLGTNAAGMSDATQGSFGIYLLGRGSLIGGMNLTPTSFCSGDCNIVSGFAQGIQVAGGDHVIQGNFIGTDVTGTADLGNQEPNNNDGAGIALYGDHNQVGGDQPEERNLISGNSYGIRMTWESRDNTITGNFIGTDASGTSAVPNGAGILQWYANPGVTGNVIGGDSDSLGGSCTDVCNLISGNNRAIELGFFDAGPDGTVIQGNFIGTDVSGTIAVPNASLGIVVGGQSEDTQIGGDHPGEGNLISGNTGAAVSEFPWYESGSTVVRARGTVVQGNRIGTTSSGLAPLGNAGGVVVTGGTVGGPSGAVDGDCSGACNLVAASGNVAASLGTIVQGNMIGTDLTGTSDFGNPNAGVTAGLDSQIGGSGPGEGNLISGNGDASGGYGIWVDATGVTIRGNLIGVAADGATPLANGGVNSSTASAGVYVRAGDVTIGGDSPGDGNTISGNRGAGITFYGPSGGVDGGLVRGNLVGVAADGATPAPNGTEGISIQYSAGNVIGGTGAGQGNTIAHNGWSGVTVVGTTWGPATGNRIRGNSIYENGGMGIQIYEENHVQAPPEISNVTANTVTVDVTGSDGTYAVDLFRNDECDPSGSGEGQTFDTTVNVAVTGGTGSQVVALNQPLTAGEVVTATATAPDGSTSEFSLCEDAGSGSISVEATAGPVDEGPDTTTITLEIENTSSVDTITLTQVDFEPPNCDQVDLAPGEIATCAIDRDLNLDRSTYDTFPFDYEIDWTSDDGTVGNSGILMVDVPVNDTLPVLSVDVTADPASVPETGGVVTYAVTVQNQTQEPFTVTDLVDDTYGDLRLLGDCANLTFVGGGLSSTCSFDRAVSGSPGATITNVVTATVQDNEGNDASDTDDATVSVLDDASSIDVTYGASPSSVLETGEPVTFTATITNTSVSDTVTITSLTDSVVGDVTAWGGSTCALPLVLSPGVGDSCSIQVTVEGQADDTVTRVLTVGGVDDDSVGVSGSDAATVDIVDAPPTVDIDYTVAPTSIPDSGANVTWTVEVSNSSAASDPVSIVSFGSDLYGPSDLAPCFTTLVGVILPGGAVSCSFEVFESGAPGTITDTFNVSVSDDEGTAAGALDSATITVADTTRPAISTYSVTPNPVAPGEGTVLEVTTLDDSPVTQGEYFFDEDPGEGVATPFDPTVPETITVPGTEGNVLLGFRVRDGAGLWSNTSFKWIGVDSGQQVASGDLADGETLTTDPDASGPTANDPFTTSVSIPGGGVAGSVSIGEYPISGGVAGYELFGQQVDISAPSQSPGNPLQITFSVLESVAGPGPHEILRNGTPIPACAGPGADPAPTCLTPVFDAGDYLVFVVRSEAASTWNLASPNPVSLSVDHTITPPWIDEPGGEVTHVVTVTNTGSVSMDVVDIVDDVHDLSDTDCADLPQTVLVGQQFSCSFVASVSGSPNDEFYDTVTVTVQQTAGTAQNQASDDASVVINNVPASLDIVASVSVPNEPGGVGTLTLTITNTTTVGDRVEVLEVTDDLFGDLRGRGTCPTSWPTSLLPGATFGCSLPVTLSGNARSIPHITNVTVDDRDGDGEITISQPGVATVGDTPPDLAVAVDVTPGSVTEPGGNVSVDVTITNTSVSTDPVTIDTIHDRDGTWAELGTCADITGDVLAPGEWVTCGYARPVEGTSPSTLQVIVDVDGRDDDGSTGTWAGFDFVTIDNVPPTLTDAYFEQNPIASTGAATLHLVATDAVAGEYWIGPDPGEGSGYRFTPGDSVIIPAPGGPGTYDVSFRVEDAAGDWSSVLTRTLTVSDATQGASDPAVAPGETVTTDPEATGPTAADPTTTSITIPIGGTGNAVSITERELTGSISGYTLLGQEVLITAPDQTVGNPLVVAFTLHQSVLPEAGLVEVFRNGTLVPDCATEGPEADPDPCVADRVDLPGGDLRIYVRTSQASTWNLGVVDAPEVAVEVNHTVDPASVPEPGGEVTHTVEVHNTSSVAVSLVDLTDEELGNLDGTGTCAIGGGIGAGDTYTCSFPRTVTGNNAGGISYDYVVSATVEAGGSSATDSDVASVSISDVPSRLLVIKSASPLAVAAPGGPVTYTVVIRNTSDVDPVTLQSIEDDMYPTLDQEIGCEEGRVLQPGEETSCTYTMNVTGDPGDEVVNTVTVEGLDDDGLFPLDSDSARVSVTDAQAALSLDVFSNPPFEVEAGSAFEWTMSVANGGPDTAQSVRVVGTLGQGQQLIDTVPVGACTQDGPSFECLLGPIPAGGTDTAGIVIQAPTEGTLSIDAEIVASSAVDTTSGDDADSASVSVIPDDPELESTYIPPNETDTTTLTVAETTTTNGDPVPTSTDTAASSVDVPPGGEGGVVTLEEQLCATVFPCSDEPASRSAPTLAKDGSERVARAVAEQQILGGIQVFLDPPEGYTNKNPILLELWYDRSIVTKKASAYPVRFAKDDASPVIELKKCSKTVKAPCIKTNVIYKSSDPRLNGDLFAVVKLTSDPKTSR
jgi:titin